MLSTPTWMNLGGILSKTWPIRRHWPIGYVKGVGVVSKQEPRMNLVGDPFYTDGLRAVLFFEPRPYTLSDIEQLHWETPSGYFETTNQK